jgi:hypothetical protein
MKIFRVVIWLKANDKSEIKNAIEIAFGSLTAERAQVFVAENEPPRVNDREAV